MSRNRRSQLAVLVNARAVVFVIKISERAHLLRSEAEIETASRPPPNSICVCHTENPPTGRLFSGEDVSTGLQISQVPIKILIRAAFHSGGSRYRIRLKRQHALKSENTFALL